MEKLRYMISDAAHITGVEAHVLRYWEDELDLEIPRNELGHRYYTRENIQQFQRIKDLKEQGYQLKAIKMVLHGADLASVNEDGTSTELGGEIGAKTAGMTAATMVTATATSAATTGKTLSAEERMDQFRELMSDIVGRAIAHNNEELSLTIGQEVEERVLKEMNYLMREQENAQEERYRKLDAAIRGNIHKKKSLFASKKKEKTKAVSPATT